MKSSHCLLSLFLLLAVSPLPHTKLKSTSSKAMNLKIETEIFKLFHDPKLKKEFNTEIDMVVRLLNRTYTKVTSLYNTTELDDHVEFSREVMNHVRSYFNSTNITAESREALEEQLLIKNFFGRYSLVGEPQPKKHQQGRYVEGVDSSCYWIVAIGGSICIFTLLHMLHHHGYSTIENQTKYDAIYYKLIEKVSPFKVVLLGFFLFWFFQVVSLWFIQIISQQKRQTQENIDSNAFNNRQVDFQAINDFVNEAKIQNPYYKNMVYHSNLTDRPEFKNYMEIQYKSLDLFKLKFPEMEADFTLQIQGMILGVMVYFVVVYKAYRSQDAFYITLLLIVQLTLVNISFNQSAFNLRLLVLNGDHCEYFMKRVHLSANDESSPSTIQNRLPFFHQDMTQLGLSMVLELRDSYITLLNFYQVRSEQFYPLQLKKTLTPMEVHRHCRAETNFSDLQYRQLCMMMEYMQFKQYNMLYYMSNSYFYEMSDMILRNQCEQNLPLYLSAFVVNLCASFSSVLVVVGLFFLEKKFLMLRSVRYHAQLIQKKLNNNVLENYLFK